MSSIPSGLRPPRPPLDPKVLLAAVWAVALVSPHHGAASYIASPPPHKAMVPAVYAFGDSIVDPGNNNRLATVAKSNFPPYGQDLNPSVPMGRFSNGRVPSDMLAEKLGVKKLLPTYLNPNLELQDILTNVSFPSGANGYDPLSAELAMVLSLSDQLGFYSECMETVRSEVGEERASAIASKSLYIVCTGANDITNTYFASPLRRSKYNI
ncbi:GDSL esterase/lipase EXL3-like [Rhodamnia argentea]|uniref:GDSL esterase/lipase EXL3-like n=1 Tax=Rhodamnia argentea TaxID=178133 RepID=A0ABM3GWA1_9MYRT|nr:GDSL esterase/lipase EXL3-like [Rhodamnia argentea]